MHSTSLGVVRLLLPPATVNCLPVELLSEIFLLVLQDQLRHQETLVLMCWCYGPDRLKWLTKQFHCRRQSPATGKTFTPTSQASVESFRHLVSDAYDSPVLQCHATTCPCAPTFLPTSPAPYSSFLTTLEALIS